MGSNIIFPPNSTSNPGFLRYETLLTVDELKRRYLYGVSFIDRSGNEIDPVVFEDSITEAISEIEHELNLTITPTKYTEYKDYDINDYRNFSFLQLDHRPTISVDTVSLQLIKGENLVSFPPEWIRLYNAGSQVQITPTSGSVSGFIIGNSGYLPVIYGVTRNFPQMIEVVYNAGFEQDKIPKIINTLIGLYASIPLLIMAGDLVLGAGIASETISLDGLSQSVSGTNNGKYNAYGARITSYQDRIKKLADVVEKYYKGITFLVS